MGQGTAGLKPGKEAAGRSRVAVVCLKQRRPEDILLYGLDTASKFPNLTIALLVTTIPKSRGKLYLTVL